jgi:hypothetical protein
MINCSSSSYNPPHTIYPLFITQYPAVDRITKHLKLSFVADKSPPPKIAYQELLLAAEPSGEYFS